MQIISKTKKMILSALLLTLSIVLSRFLSIKTPILSITFNFVPIMLSAIWLGPKYTCVISGLSDLIGAVLFPFGEFFIGFTISSITMGLIYGLILYKRECEFTKKGLIVRLIIAIVIETIVVQTILNTLWLVIMYNKAFFVLLSTRIIKEIIMIPIQVITMFVLIQALKPITKKYLEER
ncbi:MAG: folate family ECF transporter S component [Clostridia bacterium]|nr:folate family ECF transporter S component [Clostridia bacterium]